MLVAVLVKLLRSGSEGTIICTLSALLVLETDESTSTQTMTGSGSIKALVEFLRCHKRGVATSRLLEGLWNNVKISETTTSKEREKVEKHMIVNITHCNERSYRIYCIKIIDVLKVEEHLMLLDWKQSQLRHPSHLFTLRTYRTSKKAKRGGVNADSRLGNAMQRVQSSYMGSPARRARDTDELNDVAYLREWHHRNDHEAVMRWFENQSALHFQLSALSGYVRALVKVDRLDESEPLKTLQKGISDSGILSSASANLEEKCVGALPVFKNVGKHTKECALGTSNAPIPMGAADEGHFIEQLRWTVRAFSLAFLLISGVGALIEDVGITKGRYLHEEVQPITKSNTTFSDIKGVDETKSELEEIVHYFRDPKRVTRLGGKPPKCVLLVEPPGVGKTMLVRAIAGEAGVSFLFYSCSEFKEMLLGIGAQRVRDLITAAKKRSPRIIIDEIDVLSGSLNPRDQQYMKMTLKQLLVELYGFKQDEGIIVIAATNFPESWDKVLEKPDRFDRHIVVLDSVIKERRQILELQMSKVLKADYSELCREVVVRYFQSSSLEDKACFKGEGMSCPVRRDKEKFQFKTKLEGVVMTGGLYITIKRCRFGSERHRFCFSFYLQAKSYKMTKTELKLELYSICWRGNIHSTLLILGYCQEGMSCMVEDQLSDPNPKYKRGNRALEEAFRKIMIKLAAAIASSLE